MKYLLKLANGYFELVDKYTFDNSKFALAEDGESPRYEPNDWVVVNDDGRIAISLINGSPQDLAILIRGLELPPAPCKVEGGFIREPVFINFRKGRSERMLNVKTGKLYTESKAA